VLNVWRGTLLVFASPMVSLTLSVPFAICAELAMNTFDSVRTGGSATVE
jgi:hypothetical protein